MRNNYSTKIKKASPALGGPSAGLCYTSNEWELVKVVGTVNS